MLASNQLKGSHKSNETYIKLNEIKIPKTCCFVLKHLNNLVGSLVENQDFLKTYIWCLTA